jgi:Zn-dependent alcohol dehydrogenase
MYQPSLEDARIPHMRRIAAVVMGIVGCAAPAAFERVATAPKLPPSENVVVVERPPSGAVLLGTVALQLGVSALASECQEAALKEAKQAGATHVVMPPATPGTASRGPRCTAQAYYAPGR